MTSSIRVQRIGGLDFTTKLEEADGKMTEYVERIEFRNAGRNLFGEMTYWQENFDDFVWEGEAKDFIETLREAGVKTFTVTNQSTSLMENMHWFQQNGCTLMGLCEVEETDEWNREHYGNKMGVRFAL